MKVSEVIAQIARYNNLNIDQSQALDWINQFQDDVKMDGGPIKETTYATVLGGTFIALPSDFLKVLNIFENGVLYSRVGEVSILPSPTGHVIKFPQDLTTVKMWYRGKPADLTSVSSDIDVLPNFVKCAYFYILYMFYLKDSEGDPEEMSLANALFGRYTEMKAKAAEEQTVQFDSPVVTTNVLPTMGRRMNYSASEEEDS
jgi:hypothetical protein